MRPGWYQMPNGSNAYWDGGQWSQPPTGTTVAAGPGTVTSPDFAAAGARVSDGVRSGLRKATEGLESIQRKPGTGLGIHDDPTDGLPFIRVQWKSIGSILSATWNQVFRKHTTEDLENSLGLSKEDPDPAVTPGPWVFSRVIVIGIALFLVIYALVLVTANEKLIPLMLMLGAVAVPLGTALFFLESDTPKNISFFRWMTFVVLGGVVSIVITLLLPFFDTLGLGDISAMTAPFFEEPAKLAAVILLARGIKFPWVLNGLVLGAAVGAGFAIIETAGYIYDFADYGVLSMAQERGLWSFGLHVSWTAVTAAALWAVKQDKPFAWGMLTDKLFLVPFVIVILLHALWNSPLNLGLSVLLNPALAGVGFILALTYLAAGLKQYQLARQQGIDA